MDHPAIYCRMNEPLISVVMAVRDGADTIDDQLAALARQTMREPWELVVVDNGSSDDTVERVLAWQERLPSLRLLHGPSRPCQSASLNAGVAAIHGERLAFCDADDVVSDGWVSAMCQALSTHCHVTGPIELARLNPPEFVWGEHVATWLAGPVQHRFLPYAMGCNAGWRREVFSSLGGLAEYVGSCQDRDLSWRAQLSGYELWFAEQAVVHRRQRWTVLAAARQHIRAGRNETRMIARFEAYGARPRSGWEAARAWMELAARLPWLVRRRHRMRWAETTGIQIGLALPLSRAERESLRLLVKSRVGS
jgi:glycosyltransferase involved in cell wall biosynthesis